MASETGRMSVALDPDKQEKLDAIAKELDRSRNWIVGQAIDQFLEHYEWQEQRIQKRLDIAESPHAKFYSSKEAEQVVDIFRDD